ncbi:mannitol dehydrogenase family protein [Brytella acorum]|uniref:Mannitol dehydrogenase family protein n=1 Tax=Brytella acorum TaxID=2959299 RepID=A0AA35XX58_9PROT|nr:mannitol dehydrogenase family protein [Brytella acorum]MDF3625874.1 mannitol dehydrogenase family protein [Brytella acorum]CAI9121571.1 mannitol dehydrogenase family protein [Brytella acorum]
MITRETLKSLPPGVVAPGYDLAAVRPGIVHFGVGNFFRAHEALYVEKILKDDPNWAIVGVGLTDSDRSKKKAEEFRRQDCLYSLTETAPSGQSTISVIGCLRDYLLAPADPEAVLERLSDPSIRIVSMTITEGGYNIDETTGEFDLDDAAVRQDLETPERPSTIFGYVVEGLRRRRAAESKAFTVMSCDNLRHNGNVARKAFLGFAKACDPELAQWIEDNATFPNGMVDRITPTVSAATVRKLNAASGLHDDLPLVAEDFTQWVLEDRFADGRPPLEKSGVQFVDDVTDYEYVKIRMLNAAHVLLAFPAVLLGYEHIDEAVNDPDLKALDLAFLNRDVIPTLKAPPGMTLEGYRDSVLSRFSNPAMADQTLRIASDGSSKIQVFWTDTIRKALQNKGDLTRIAFGMAAYLEMLRGVNEKGESYKHSEPTFKDRQKALAKADDFESALQLPSFDPWRDLDTSALDAKVVAFRKQLRAEGVRATLRSLGL